MNTGAHGRVLRPRSVEAIREALSEASSAGRTVGLRGTGCSYGDASINSQGLSLDLTHMNQILGFDASTGIADLEAGVTIEQLWKHILPQGYWPKVVSGTMFPTVAGAAAMNIHGKNNFRVGTFGDNVLEFDLVLPSGELRTCNREQNTDLFHAAIGGLGMLGCFSRLQLQTKRIHSGKVRVRGESVRNLAAMMAYFEAEKGRADYLVGWVDCFARGDGLGRGLIHDAEYLAEGEDPEPEETMQVAYQELPGSILGFPKGEVWRFLRLINTPFGMRLLNALKQQAGRVEGHQGWYERRLQLPARLRAQLEVCLRPQARSWADPIPGVPPRGRGPRHPPGDSRPVPAPGARALPGGLQASPARPLLDDPRPRRLEHGHGLQGDALGSHGPLADL